MNVNDYVIADTVFGAPVLWASEKIFMNANRMGALKEQYHELRMCKTAFSYRLSKTICFLSWSLK